MKTCKAKSKKTFGGKIWKHLHSVSPYNFLVKNLKRLPLKSFWSQKFLKGINWQKMASKTTAPPRKKKQCWYFNFKLVFSRLKRNFSQRVFKFHFSTNFSDGFCARWCKSSSRHEKHEMTSGSKMKFNHEMDFELSQKGPWNTVSTNRVEFYIQSSLFDLQLSVACHFISFYVGR